MKVYMLENMVNEGKYVDDYKIIGVFETEKEAQDKISEIQGKPGFSEYPNKFQIQKFNVDEGLWENGFETIKQ